MNPNGKTFSVFERNDEEEKRWKWALDKTLYRVSRLPVFHIDLHKDDACLNRVDVGHSATFYNEIVSSFVQVRILRPSQYADALHVCMADRHGNFVQDRGHIAFQSNIRQVVARRDSPRKVVTNEVWHEFWVLFESDDVGLFRLIQHVRHDSTPDLLWQRPGESTRYRLSRMIEHHNLGPPEDVSLSSLPDHLVAGLPWKCAWDIEEVHSLPLGDFWNFSHGLFASDPEDSEQLPEMFPWEGELCMTQQPCHLQPCGKDVLLQQPRTNRAFIVQETPDHRLGIKHLIQIKGVHSLQVDENDTNVIWGVTQDYHLLRWENREGREGEETWFTDKGVETLSLFPREDSAFVESPPRLFLEPLVVLKLEGGHGEGHQSPVRLEERDVRLEAIRNIPAPYVFPNIQRFAKRTVILSVPPHDASPSPQRTFFYFSVFPLFYHENNVTETTHLHFDRKLQQLYDVSVEDSYGKQTLRTREDLWKMNYEMSAWTTNVEKHPPVCFASEESRELTFAETCQDIVVPPTSWTGKHAMQTIPWRCNIRAVVEAHRNVVSEPYNTHNSRFLYDMCQKVCEDAECCFVREEDHDAYVQHLDDVLDRCPSLSALLQRPFDPTDIALYEKIQKFLFQKKSQERTWVAFQTIMHQRERRARENMQPIRHSHVFDAKAKQEENKKEKEEEEEEWKSVSLSEIASTQEPGSETNATFCARSVESFDLSEDIARRYLSISFLTSREAERERPGHASPFTDMQWAYELHRVCLVELQDLYLYFETVHPSVWVYMVGERGFHVLRSFYRWINELPYACLCRDRTSQVSQFMRVHGHKIMNRRKLKFSADQWVRHHFTHYFPRVVSELLHAEETCFQKVKEVLGLTRQEFQNNKRVFAPRISLRSLLSWLDEALSL
eukprot:CAMPEP_0113875840 /NCGR_PEP_ID=MMETSP0780_2-20120614/5158_1 /TAXON_ID=652834 /ORGANISM="Palpitomonas bilix" /LENGTH=894 /DNA_ID=CAMNT_0000861859 /DNA_START=238 /DNA_END=2922 /DNA_ORIENTATION=- /assembly_acc=CAM_ASM_000599